MMLKSLPKWLASLLIVSPLFAFAAETEGAPAFAHRIIVDSSNTAADPYQTGKRVTLTSGSINVANGSITLWYTANNGNLIPSGTFAPGNYDGIQTGALVVTYSGGNNPPGDAILNYN